ncbi:cobalt ECF transporter T component CbiQ [Desulfolucanica intricata]|uniref:cobalt ECF transporter T component CbiQ n=1 Tax=Desulfolucanica intricata TaxID=1285191 RepID=UPI00083055CC|nr:cobalt ECF transporter T component CbiQ [Desulfolucanica intricata]
MDLLLGAVRENSPLYRIDPRVKMLAIFVFIAFTSSLRSMFALAAAALFMISLAAVARVTPGIILKRLAWVVPFAGVMVLFFPFILPGEPVFNLNLGIFNLTATDKGLEQAAVLSFRVFVAVMAVTVLTATTKFKELLNALRDLKVPSIFVDLVEFNVRYIFVLVDEVSRMRIARRARNFQNGKTLFNRHTFKTLGASVAVLFIRSYERGDRIYNAMLSRGYSGQVKAKESASLKVVDLCWGLIICVVGMGLRLAEFGGNSWPILLK